MTTRPLLAAASDRLPAHFDAPRFLDDLATQARPARRPFRTDPTETPLMGFRGQWDGYAQAPIGTAPTPILERAHAFFRVKRAETPDTKPSDSVLRAKLTRQIDAIAAVLARRAA